MLISKEENNNNSVLCFAVQTETELSESGIFNDSSLVVLET